MERMNTKDPMRHKMRGSSLWLRYNTKRASGPICQHYIVLLRLLFTSVIDPRPNLSKSCRAINAIRWEPIRSGYASVIFWRIKVIARWRLHPETLLSTLVHTHTNRQRDKQRDRESQQSAAAQCQWGLERQKISYWGRIGAVALDPKKAMLSGTPLEWLEWRLQIEEARMRTSSQMSKDNVIIFTINCSLAGSGRNSVLVGCYGKLAPTHVLLAPRDGRKFFCIGNFLIIRSAPVA